LSIELKSDEVLLDGVAFPEAPRWRGGELWFSDMTAQKVMRLGATGVYGRHLVPRLAAAGHRVCALMRRPEAAAVAGTWGAELAQADIFD
jgi:hypothetical protein